MWQTCKLKGLSMAKIAILVEKIYEDLELQYPRLRLKEAGHHVDVIGPKAGEIYIGM
jgi:protease I